MTAVNHDAWNTISGLIVFFAERTVVLIKKFSHELVNLFAIEVRWVLGLLEEECGRVFELFH